MPFQTLFGFALQLHWSVNAFLSRINELSYNYDTKHFKHHYWNGSSRNIGFATALILFLALELEKSIFMAFPRVAIFPFTFQCIQPKIMTLLTDDRKVLISSGLNGCFNALWTGSPPPPFFVVCPFIFSLSPSREAAHRLTGHQAPWLLLKFGCNNCI